MHLLYLDDSGSAKNAQEDYLVLAGISVFEHQCYFLSSELDKIAQSLDAKNFNEIEFHASEIFARRVKPWSDLSRDEAQGIIKSVLKVVADAYDSTVLFACAIHKNSYSSNDPMSLAFEDLCQRFDSHLRSINGLGDRQRGMLILDDSAHETTLQAMARNFRQNGTQWGFIKYLADTPFFVNSKSSRIIQIADHIAYAVFRRYNNSDAQYFDIIADRFQTGSDGVIHGLAHKQKIKANCMCPGCHSRRLVKAKESEH